jgi:hypothetical protein
MSLFNSTTPPERGGVGFVLSEISGVNEREASV